MRRTILGEQQETWLFDNLTKPAAQWTVLGQQVPTFARDMASANRRLALLGRQMGRLRRLAEATVRRIFSDAKVAEPDRALRRRARALVRRSQDGLRRIPRSPTIGVEFTNSSITSGGDGTDEQPAWPLFKGDNPHITYHGNRRGYLSCTATPKTMRADFRVIDKVSERGAPVRTAATRVVEAGRPGSLPS